MKRKRVSSNAAELADAPRVVHAERHVLDAQQAQHFLETAKADALAPLYNTYNLSHEFAGAWVLDELLRRVSKDAWFPNLRILVSYGVVEKSGESTRAGKRAYYRMPDPDGVSHALSDLGHAEWPAY